MSQCSEATSNTGVQPSRRVGVTTKQCDTVPAIPMLPAWHAISNQKLEA